MWYLDDKSYWSSLLRGYNIRDGEDIPGTEGCIPGAGRAVVAKRVFERGIFVGVGTRV